MKRSAWWMLSVVVALLVGYFAGSRGGGLASDDDPRAASLKQAIADSGRVATALRHSLDSMRTQVAAATSSRDSLRLAADSLRKRLKSMRDRVRTTYIEPAILIVGAVRRTPVIFTSFERPRADTIGTRIKLPMPSAADAPQTVPDRAVPYVRIAVDDHPAIAPRLVVQVMQLQDSVIMADASDRVASDTLETSLRTSLAESARLANAERSRFDASQALYEGSQAALQAARKNVKREKRKSFLKGLGTGVITTLVVAGLASL